MGNACGGKLGCHGSKAILLSHVYGVEPAPWPLSPHTPASAAENREAGPSNASPLNWRVGPQPGVGGPSMCLTCLTVEKDPRQGNPLSA